MSDWVTAVAERADVGETEAGAVLDHFLVRPTPTLPRPHHLAIRQVTFSGVKDLEGGHEEFEFNWQLGEGVWAVASESDNLVGKSSVLEIIRWALRGRSGDLQADVKRWLRHVSVAIDVDSQPYVVRFDVRDGMPTGVIAGDDAANIVHGFFDNGDEFATTAEAFFMEQLGLEPIPFWQNDPRSEDGGRQSHSWAAYADAFHIHDVTHVIGDQPMAGLPGKLLEVFVGLPWAATYNMARIALQQHEQQQRDEGRRAQRLSAGMADQIETLRRQVQQLQSRLDELPDTTERLAQRDRALGAVQAADSAWLAATTARSAAADAARTASEALREDRRRLKDAQETTAIRRFFHGVDPVMCPHCSAPVTDDRRTREATVGACAMCGSESPEVGDLEELIADLQQRVDASAEAVTAARTARDAATANVRRAEVERAAAKAQLESLEAAEGVLEQRRQVELDLTRATAVLEERERYVSLPAETPSEDIAERVLKAAIKEAETRLGAQQTTLFGAVNDEVRRLGRAFGIENLEMATLDRAGRLRVAKGGATAHFSSCSDGERLRLKIAVVVALVRIGAQHGVGRYPGLILLDSPGAYETSEEDLAAILGEVQTIADELPQLQVIAASAQAPILRRILADERLRVAPAGGVLW